MAEEMGKGLGRGALLLRAVPKKERMRTIAALLIEELAKRLEEPF